MFSIFRFYYSTRMYFCLLAASYSYTKYMVYFVQHDVFKRYLIRNRKDTCLAGTIETHPSENSNWRKHKNACPFYRERWFPCNDVSGEPMYQIFCLKGTPPITAEEQEKCFHSKTCCWRLANTNRPNMHSSKISKKDIKTKQAVS